MSAYAHGGNIFAIARSLGVIPEEVIDFSASINPLGPAPGVREAILSSFDRLLHYPDNSACDLTASLSAYHGVPCESIAIGNGSTELIHLIPRLVSGRRALVVAPAFSEYASALARNGWECDYFTLTSDSGFSLSIPELAQTLSRGYQLLFLCNPGNPTGTLLPKEAIEEVLRVCESTGTFAVIDEAFIDFCEEESAKGVMKDFPGGLLLRSMTKFFAIPGLRLGYAVGTAATISRLAALQPPWSVNTAAQLAGIASLADAPYQKATRELVTRERALLVSGLDQLGWLTVFPSAPNYLLACIENGLGAAELQTRLVRKGIIIRDCSNFEGLDSRFFRVAVRSRSENERLLQELGTVI
ncbi:threonine-phosphate decarboxylase CobD [Geomonas sp. RF6]|uniref:threonine-phosphate decarboxylase CobD n=1 Tax=Geomonas sp. RF6 TaxID=2897342 RepID=UPI001E4531EB|nr:threonine-phosphate decarboxylase CobD [Geomonas sp. RF6]UFS71800.1 threonine-phosphate decarboxylase CobD [Geomonas sp. RF6]